ncbi:exonuclease domain-containing protein [Clostridium estertheticum]|uniref:3'-5' exonuclease n=1 Tax=Clostridium estertheticum TaxID=238834 RepID=UPI001C7CB9C2|nr:3'-5' exonuclease [Clostridium estertheticum]MBX4261623.1 exonuclease domain-containing protein [Clostridium estertheticum]WLC70326.1 exonuclease domain-containing protein [Clostridium estertheticum]
MNYIVFDLEFNQGYNFTKETKETKETKSAIDPKCPFEIIQIGAIKLNDNFETISTLDMFVKPEIYTTLNPFVKRLTGLTIDELNTGKSFKEMYEIFSNFITSDRSVLCVWGVADITELFRNIAYYELDSTIVPLEYINIQSYASKKLSCEKGINIGLSNAAKLLDIPIESQFHDALNDAYYTAEVFKKIYTKNPETSIYNPSKRKRVARLNTENYKTDFPNLMKQFGKMFERELTVDEKSIIKLAYIMGKTNQFQIKIDSEVKPKK